MKLFGSFISEQFKGTISNMKLFGSTLKTFFKNPKKQILSIFKTLRDRLLGLTQKYFPFFINIIEKLTKGFQKLKTMFTGGGLKKTLANLGSSILSAIGGAFTSVKDAFKNAFSSVFDTFLGLIDMLIYHISKYIPNMEDRGDAYKVSSAEAYITEQAYIRAYSEKYKVDDDRLHNIAKGKVSEESIKAGAEMDFYKSIKNLKIMEEGQQIAHLKELVKAVREGNMKKETNLTVSTGGTQTEASLKKEKQ